MVRYETSDLIPIQDFAYAWRITDSRWDNLPTEVLAGILPLSKNRSLEVSELLGSFRDIPNSGEFTINQDYQITEKISLHEETEEDDVRIKRWLNGLPINPSESVYLRYSDTVVVVVGWGIFNQIWDSLCYPMEQYDVFDETLEWAVRFGLGGEEALFLTKRESTRKVSIRP